MDLLAAAVDNNADWCDLVCRKLGLAPVDTAEYWCLSQPPPLFYPSAVTRRRNLTHDQVEAMVARSGGGAVKDSYAELDLASWGYQVLFDAEWMCHEPLAATTTFAPGWGTVDSAEELDEWSAVHGSREVFGEGLLRDGSVRFLALRDDAGRTVAGAIANRSARVVGLSNAFWSDDRVGAPWPELVRAASVCFPDLPLVGYERGDQLTAAALAGFVTVGPLRVWLRS